MGKPLIFFLKTKPTPTSISVRKVVLGDLTPAERQIVARLDRLGEQIVVIDSITRAQRCSGRNFTEICRSLFKQANESLVGHEEYLDPEPPKEV